METINTELQRSTGGKVNAFVFERALSRLARAGFTGDMIGVYILAGLPFQKWEEVKEAIDYLAPFGVMIHIAEYTPIPHTPLFEAHHAHARYPIAEDAVYQNNALFPFAWQGFADEDLSFVKRYAREKNEAAIAKTT